MSDARTTDRRIIEDATCLGCACLCDDIGLVVEDGRIVEARNACPMGRDWYGVGREIPEESPRVDGPPRGLGRGASIGPPRCFGGHGAAGLGARGAATVEAQAASRWGSRTVSGAFVGIAGQEDGGSRPFQRVGQGRATLGGEVKDRVDVIVYDIDFPIERLPRLRDRYADDAVGRFVPGGRAGRTVIRLRRGGQRSSPGESDHEIVVQPKFPDRVLHGTLRAVANRGVTRLDPAAVERSTRTFLWGRSSTWRTGLRAGPVRLRLLRRELDRTEGQP